MALGPAARGPAGPAYDVVVLAGGAARRLGGVDKPGLQVGGRRLIDRVLDGCSAAARVVVAGPQRPVASPVRWCREDPPGGGPFAGVAAAFPLTSADVVVVVAADMPLVGTAVPALAEALTGEGALADAAALVDAAGVRQPLAAAYRRSALAARLAAHPAPAGVPARRLLEGLAVHEVSGGNAAADCDTWADLARAERALSDPPPAAGAGQR